MNQKQLFIIKSRKQIATSSKNLISSVPSDCIDKDDCSKNDLYLLMKPLVLVGLITRLIPNTKDTYVTSQASFSVSRSLFYITSFLLWTWTIFQAICVLRYVINYGYSSQIGMMGYITSSTYFMDSFVSFLLYSYFIRKSANFFKIFESCAGMVSKFHLEHDKFLSYFLIAIYLAQLFAYSSTIIELYVKESLNSSSISHMFEMMFKNNWPEYNDFLPNHPVIVIVVSLLYCWSASHRMLVSQYVIFFARVVSYQFRKLVEVAANTELSEIQYANLQNKGRQFWIDLVNNYRELVRFFKTINNFMSPLVFFCVGLNIFHLSVQLFRALSGKDLLGVSSFVFAIWFAIDLAVFLVMILSAAQVNKNAMKILEIFRYCPKEEFYSTEVCRLEHQMTMSPNIGFSGMGCFVITRPFIIKVFNAILSLELVMLQFATN